MQPFARDRRRLLALIALSAWGAGAALAQDGGADVPELRVGVGRSTEFDAQAAVGIVCDDATLFDLKVRERRFLVFTGVRAGSTLCRVGTDFELPHVFLRLTVTGR